MHRDEVIRYITSEIAPDVSPSEIEGDYDLVENGVIDSLAMVRLVAWLGERFGMDVNEIDIAPTDLATINSIQRFIDIHINEDRRVTA